MEKKYDAIVVGARCAGAACAMLLGRAGLDVLMIDRGRYGTDTLSTHALMRPGVLQLHYWGVLESVLEASTPVVRRTSFHYGDDVVAIDIKRQPGVEGLCAPRRFVIDAALVDAAVEAGVTARWETTLHDLETDATGRVNGVVVKGADGVTRSIKAPLVIGADGLRSTIARLVGAQTYHTGAHATGVVFSYFSDTGLDGYHWYYRPNVSAGVIHTNSDQVCVFVAVPSTRFKEEIRFDVAAGHAKVLGECDRELASAIAGGRREMQFRGFPGQVGFLRQSHGPGWALVGDAGYFKDPITAHGMTDALIDAELLARAVLDGRPLAAYQEARDARALGLLGATDAIASFEWDLPAVQKLHYTLSNEMKRETSEVVALHQAPETPEESANDKRNGLATGSA